MGRLRFGRRTRVDREPNQSSIGQGFVIDPDDAAITLSRSVRVINSSHPVPNPWTRSSLPGSRRSPLLFASAPICPTASEPKHVIEDDPDISLENAARSSERRRRRATVWVAALTTIVAIGVAYYAER